MLVLYNFDSAFHEYTGVWANEDIERYTQFMHTLEGKFQFDLFNEKDPIIYVIYDTEEDTIHSRWTYYPHDYDEYEDSLYNDENYDEEFNVLAVLSNSDTKNFIGALL